MKLKNTLQEKNITKDNMQRKNVIVVISEEVEVFGNFKKMCEAKGFPYHSLKMKPFPITHENVVIHRVPFKQRLTFDGYTMVGIRQP